jgi:hypothetical protein
VLPVTTNERAFSIFCIVLGAFMYAYIIGAFSTIMSTMNHDTSQYDMKMRQVTTYLRFINAEPSLMRRGTCSQLKPVHGSVPA